MNPDPTSNPFERPQHARLAAGVVHEYPTPSDERTTRVMKRVPGADTKPEVALRSALHRNGLRFRKNMRLAVEDVRVRADIVFQRHRVAVFVDGCFWHGCPDHFVLPKSNQEFWREKMRHNRKRDQHVTRALSKSGWTVLRYWEHMSIDEAVSLIKLVLERASSSSEQTNDLRLATKWTMFPSGYRSRL